MIMRHKAVLELLRALGHDPDVVTEVHVTHKEIEVMYLEPSGDEAVEYHYVD